MHRSANCEHTIIDAKDTTHMAQAPGSLVLFGEYAVLKGYPAIGAKVNRYLTTQVSPRTDNQIHIHSSLGSQHGTIDSFKVEAPLEYVGACINHYRNQLHGGFELDITSDFSHKLGFASSAAVVIATLKAMHQWLGIKDMSPAHLFSLAKTIKQQVHSVGSGIGLVPAICDNHAYFNPTTLQIEAIDHSIPLVVIYTGDKVKTHTMISKINAKEAQNPSRFSELYQAIGHITERAKASILNENWPRLGKLACEQQHLMQSLGVSNPMIDELLQSLNQLDSIFGSKISGAGMGDCIIAFGTLDDQAFQTLKEQYPSIERPHI